MLELAQPAGVADLRRAILGYVQCEEVGALISTLQYPLACSAFTWTCCSAVMVRDFGNLFSLTRGP
jgi:hypothetical protein